MKLRNSSFCAFLKRRIWVLLMLIEQLIKSNLAFVPCLQHLGVTITTTTTTRNTAIAPTSSISTSTQLYNTGGWGIGPQRELTPGEFAKRSDRRAFEGYTLRDRGEFMRQVAQDKQDLQMGELNELLGVARIAGIKVKDPAERMNKFEVENNDDDELDLSVPLDKGKEDQGVEQTEQTFNEYDESITRLDEDTGAAGEW